MASGNGNWSPTTGGGNRGRLEWQIDQSPASVGAGTSSVSLRLRVWYRSRYSISDSSNTYTISGSWSGSGSRSINHGGSGGRTLLFDGTISVSTSYAGTVSRNFTASFTGINATPNIPNVSKTHTVGRRPVSAPNAPSGVSFTRTSDTVHVIRWTRNATTARPYDRQRVQRQEITSSGSWPSTWITVATVSGTATSYTDRSTKANSAYRWRVVADNATGSPGISGVTNAARTTPSSPVLVGVKRQGDSVQVIYRHRAPYSTVAVDVQGRAGGGAWQTLVTGYGSNGYGNQTWTHTDPDPAQTWQYRVRARASNPTLTSGWSPVSAVVQLLAPPNAPTIIGPVGVVDINEPVRFEWLFNTVDSSDQTAVNIQAREPGGSWGNVSASELTIEDNYFERQPYSTLGPREFRIRTKGAHPGWSPWSIVGTFTVAARPTVAINSPAGGTLEQSRVDVEVGYYQEEGSPLARVSADLLQEGGLVESIAWASGDTGSFRTPLDDGVQYTVRVRVQAGNGLWSEYDEATFVTEFPAPLPVLVEGEWDRVTGSVGLSFLIDGVEAGYRWTGVPGQSTSEMVVDGQVQARNLIHNGSFEYVDGSDVPVGWHGNYADITAPSLSDAGLPHDFVFAPYGGVIGDRLAFTESEEGEYLYVSNSTPFPVTAGEWVGFGALVAVASEFPEARIRVRFLDDDNAAVGGLAGTEYESAAFPDGTEIIGAAQVPAGATRARVLVYAKEAPPYVAAAYIDAVRADVAATEMEALNRVLRYFDGDKQSDAPIETLTVQRRDTPDSPWVTIAENVDTETEIIDPTPMLVAPEYRAISHTNLPSSTTGPVTVVPLPKGLWPVFLNTGEAFSHVVPVFDNTKYSADTARGKTQHKRAGRRLPVTKWGEHRQESYTLNATLNPNTPAGSVADLQDLEDQPYVACYRDVLGHKHFVTIDNVSASVERNGWWNVNIPMTGEDFDENTAFVGGSSENPD